MRALIHALEELQGFGELGDLALQQLQVDLLPAPAVPGRLPILRQLVLLVVDAPELLALNLLRHGLPLRLLILLVGIVRVVDLHERGDLLDVGVLRVPLNLPKIKNTPHTSLLRRGPSRNEDWSWIATLIDRSLRNDSFSIINIKLMIQVLQNIA